LNKDLDILCKEDLDFYKLKLDKDFNSYRFYKRDNYIYLLEKIKDHKDLYSIKDYSLKLLIKENYKIKNGM